MAKTADSEGAFPDVWRRIPPEEKLEMMAKAHSKGMGASLVLLLMTATVAVGMRFPWVFWGAFLAVPFVFQFVAAKAWRDVKPRAMLEYLAARSAARRYAYGAQAQDLAIDHMFKGYVERARSESDEIDLDFDPAAPKDPRTPVWVALFHDTIVMISEQPGGARLEFVAPLFERLQATAEGFDEGDPQGRRMRFEVQSKHGNSSSTWYLTSNYPASLLACERKIRMLEHEHKVHAERSAQLQREIADNAPLGLSF